MKKIGILAPLGVALLTTPLAAQQKNDSTHHEPRAHETREHEPRATSTTMFGVAAQYFRLGFRESQTEIKPRPAHYHESEAVESPYSTVRGVIDLAQQFKHARGVVEANVALDFEPGKLAELSGNLVVRSAPFYHVGRVGLGVGGVTSFLREEGSNSYLLSIGPSAMVPLGGHGKPELVFSTRATQRLDSWSEIGNQATFAEAELGLEFPRSIKGLDNMVHAGVRVLTDCVGDCSGEGRSITRWKEFYLGLALPLKRSGLVKQMPFTEVLLTGSLRYNKIGERSVTDYDLTNYDSPVRRFGLGMTIVK